MKNTLLILSLLLTSMSYAQSKKALIYQVDSLNNIVALQKSDISTYKKKLDDLQTTIANLNSQVSNLTKELNLKKSEAQNQTQELTKIKEQLKVKSDSLTLVLNELDKLKPPPVKVNSTPPVANQQVGPFKTVTIGTQVWMTKNLDVSTFRNGDPIPEVKTNEEWLKAGENNQPAWCYYDNNPANGVKYGKLYNWYAVNDPRGLAPVGYHIPTDAEWTILEDFLGDDEGKKMKTTSGWEKYEEEIKCSYCKNWNSEYRRKNSCHKCKDTRVNGKKTNSGNGTNSSGFSGLPGGRRENYFGVFINQGISGDWWSSTEFNTDYAYPRYLYHDNDLLIGSERKKVNGFSVRCIKD